MEFRKLTTEAHNILSKHIKYGDKVIDATLGNGIDTLFLAKKVGEKGRVFAFDIQKNAIIKTKKLLKQNNISDIVTIVNNSHETMKLKLPVGWLGKVRAVMFNLGYLPGGDKNIITKPDSTVKALDASFQFLEKGGLLTIIAYKSHPGGKHEFHEVSDWVKKYDLFLSCKIYTTNDPILYICKKL